MDLKIIVSLDDGLTIIYCTCSTTRKYDFCVAFYSVTHESLLVKAELWKQNYFISRYFACNKNPQSLAGIYVSLHTDNLQAMPEKHFLPCWVKKPKDLWHTKFRKSRIITLVSSTFNSFLRCDITEGRTWYGITQLQAIFIG